MNYDIGDLVRRSQPKIIMGTKAKLARKWTGPWTVIKRLSDVLYQIQLSKTSKPVIIHSDNIKLYRGSKTTSDPRIYPDEYPDQTLSADQTPRAREDSSLDSGRALPRLQRNAETIAAPARNFDQSEAELRMTRRGRVLKRPARFRD